MALGTIDVTCLRCEAVLRVIHAGSGPDEKKWFACPESGRSLFSADERGIVYDIDGVVKRGRPEAKSRRDD
jgi:hypothetical protein